MNKLDTKVERLSNRIVEILDNHFHEYLKDKPNKRKTVKGLIKALVLDVKAKEIKNTEKRVRRETVEAIEEELDTHLYCTTGDDNCDCVKLKEFLKDLEQ